MDIPVLVLAYIACIPTTLLLAYWLEAHILRNDITVLGCVGWGLVSFIPLVNTGAVVGLIVAAAVDAGEAAIHNPNKGVLQKVVFKAKR